MKMCPQNVEYTVYSLGVNVFNSNLCFCMGEEVPVDDILSNVVGWRAKYVKFFGLLTWNMEHPLTSRVFRKPLDFRRIFKVKTRL